VADDPSVQIVSNAQTWYIKDMLKEHASTRTLPLLSAAAPFKAGGRGGADYYTDVPAGDIAIKNVADLYLYPNTVQAVVITGAQVKNWLEMSAGMFNTVAPGAKDVALLNTTFPSYNFDIIDGVTYQIDLSQPAKYDGDGKAVNPDSNRIQNLAFERQADRSGAEIRRRLQQLSRRRRWQIPGNRQRQGGLRRPRHQPRRHRPLHHRRRHDQPVGRRQLEFQAGGRRDGGVRERPEGARADC
jgi:hypothetical protein